MNDLEVKRISFAERCLQAIMALAVLAAFVILASGISAKAAEVELDIIEINYENSTLTIELNPEDNIIFMSNSSMKKWEYVPALIREVTGEDGKIHKVATMDISWVSVSKAYIMTFKGDYSQTPIKVTIPKQQTNFKVQYDMYKGTVKFTNPGETVQWKKKDAFEWQEYAEDEFTQQLENFIDNGATLVFRNAPENGENQDEPGKRPSKEVSLNIPKKTAAPVITINDTTMSVMLKKNLKYRYVDENGNVTDSEWILVPVDKDTSIEEIASKALYDEEDNPNPEDVYIQFCQAASASAQMSKVKTIKIPAQEPMTAADMSAENTKLEYTSGSNFNLTFRTAGDSNKFEYMIITPDKLKMGVSIDDLINLKDSMLVWKEVGSSEPVILGKNTDKNLTDKSVIYYRRKAQGTLGSDDYKLASPIMYLGEVQYPEGATTDTFKMLYTISGMCEGGKNNLNFTFFSSQLGKINEIEFFDEGKTSKGTAKFTYTATKAAETGLYTYNVSLTDLSNIKSTRTLLYAYVYFEGESGRENASIQSTNEKGVALYIYPGTTVNNPSSSTEKKTVAERLGWSDYDPDTDRIGFTSAIKRVYKSNRKYDSEVGEDKITADKADQTQFRVKLDFGTMNVPALGQESAVASEKYTASLVEVAYLKYDNVALRNDTSDYYSVEYYNDESGTYPVRYAVITLNVDKIEQNGLIDDRDKDSKLSIVLNNGEVISDGITMNLQLTAVPESNSITFTENKLEVWKEVKTTDASGNTVSTRERALDKYYKIKLNIPSTLGDKSSYEVGVKSATWKDDKGYTRNVMYEASRDGNVLTVILDSELLNNIDVSATVTNNIRIEMTNGYVITSGIPMTINPDTSVIE